MLKEIIRLILRNLYLIQVVNYVFFIKDIIRNKKSNSVFLKNNPEFIMPPYSLAYDACNHTNWEHYYELGKIHSNLISSLVKKHISKNEIKVYEWGCGPMRVLRHLNQIEGFNSVQLYGSDYNKKSINWCIENFKQVNFINNNLKPPLSYNNESFDCVYAISIFTHLSEERHYLWIKELHRVLKNNGILIFTTHGDLCSNRLLKNELERYSKGQIVVRGKVKEGKKHFLAYHPHDFIKNKLLNKFEILEHIIDPRHHHLEQEVWVVKKYKPNI